jgi:transposase-like protein
MPFSAASAPSAERTPCPQSATAGARATSRRRRANSGSRFRSCATRPSRSPRSLFPRESRRLLTTEPLKALVVGALVRGLSMRDVEALCEEAGLGQVSASSVSRICSELKDRYRAFRERELSEIELVALYLDAIYLPVRPMGRKEGVLCAWGIDSAGKRVLIDVCLGMRESEEDWTALGRGLVGRGLRCPRWSSRTARRDSRTRSRRCGPRPTASAAPCIGCETSWPRVPKSTKA